ncbi:MAG: sterol desaturase family protein [Myxococcota bacterium]|nr:sterol desaturase family protein [Myxococcota bacterium]
MNIDYRVAILLLFLVIALIEVGKGRFSWPRKTTRKDLILELTSGFFIPVIIVPGAFLGAMWLGKRFLPELENIYAELPGWAMFLALIFADDLSQYWWHRISHSVPKLYSFHRAHHSAEYMSVSIVYRNSLIYYFLMPGIWLSGLLVYLGFGVIYPWYAVAKLTVIMSAHSSVPWDQPLYKNKWSRPVMRFLACIISTPTTHAAHHGKHLSDAATHYKGNFGNFFFFWDLLFGTAMISEQRPKAYGLENVTPASWFAELLWPPKIDSNDHV